MFQFKVEKTKAKHCCNSCNKILEKGNLRVKAVHWNKRYCLKCGYDIAIQTSKEVKEDQEKLKRFIKSFPLGVAVAEEI